MSIWIHRSKNIPLGWWFSPLWKSWEFGSLDPDAQLIHTTRLVPSPSKNLDFPSPLNGTHYIIKDTHYIRNQSLGMIFVDLLKLFQWDTKQDQCSEERFQRIQNHHGPVRQLPEEAKDSEDPHDPGNHGKSDQQRPWNQWSQRKQKTSANPPHRKGYHTIFPRGLSKKKSRPMVNLLKSGICDPKKRYQPPCGIVPIQISGKVHGTSVGNLPWHIPFSFSNIRGQLDSWGL